MSEQRKKQILGALLAIFVLSLGYRIFHPFRQARVDKLAYTGERKPAVVKKKTPEAGTAANDSVQVMSDLFAKPPKHSGKALTPSFFRKIPGVIFAAPQPTESVSDLVSESGEKPGEGGPGTDKPAEDPMVVVDRELGRFQVTGVYAQGGELAAFLQSEKQILVVRKGDRIDGKYLIEGISPESITLRAEHLEDTVHISLKQFLTPFERERLSKK